MKIGFLSLPLTGHLNPMTALARKLQSRGLEVVFIGVPDSESVVRAADLEFVPFCESEYPSGTVAKTWGAVAKLHGLDVIRYTARKLTPGLVKAALEHLPRKIAESGVDSLILDTTYRFLGIVPMHLRLPYVQIWNVLHFDVSGSTPLTFYSWPHETNPEALTRNVKGLQILRELGEPVMPIARSYAERNGLKIWERLNGKPLIYASMGTLVNGLPNVYGTILEAASEFPEMQMVLSVGRNFNPDDLGRIPSNTIVVRTAPQIDLLKRAALCITHAGLNTALEALAQGVPMVAIPVGFDQPGVAARIAYHGVGEFIEVGNLTTRRLSDLIARIKENPKYRYKAGWFQKVLAETRGLDIAADIVERAFEDRFEDKFRSRMLANSSAEETHFLPGGR
jgi:zeaxanthin glucosyltransferase